MGDQAMSDQFATEHTPTDDVWQPHFEALGGFLRAQRQLANLSLREMARRTKVSNAYLSQIERGMHEPSVRVLGSIARALDLSSEVMLAQAGLFGNVPVPGGSDTPSSPEEAVATGLAADTAILGDARLTGDQKEALLRVYRSFLDANGRE